MQRIPGRGEGRKRGGQAARRRLRRSPHPLRLGGGGGGGTMPRDNMASLIQRVARQARVTFRPPGANNNSSAGGGGGSGAGGNGGPRFVENLQRLQQLLNEVRAEDLRLVPRGPSAVPGPVQPPVSYMHICETESFSMGVFVLRAGACIPLHDHPGMNGLLKVLYGTLRIACHGRDCHYYRLLDGQSLPPPGPADQLGLPKEVWLLETPQAADFWCGGEPYPGPQVSP
nr:2-aminoethanethiol dioxygenase [Pogona vitticeps]